MSTQVVVQGMLKPDGTLELDDKVLMPADGKTYDITHPERIFVGKRSFIFGVVLESPGQDNGETAYDRYETVSMLHVVWLEPLSRSQRI
jgi:hypothetical protein